MKMNLYIVDHRYDIFAHPNLYVGSIGFKQIVDALPENYQIVESNLIAQYAIVHYPNSILNQLDTSTNLEGFPDLQIFFCVTTDYKNGPIGYSEKERPHQKKVSGNKTRYVFYGRKLDELNEPQILQKVLKAFLSLTAEQADAIFERDFDKMPKDLIEIFHITKFDNLAALSVLCQGYLAIHPNTNLNREVMAYLPKDVSLRIKKTEETEWWQKPFGKEKKDTLIEKITAEWQPQQLPTEVSNLIEAIYSITPITDVEIVEAGYKAIAARLTSI
jgi:hypothetical protein